ncbi:MAG: DEAD/DEAH box helicase [Hyphomicrobiales bacterium]|nr:DEAD/DEAH box helicase [Hyphomicrobiales bacterium]MCP5372823.1 DEAD/DEAH box helicase [Hyphomicrobiales bacterium]
MTFSDLGLSDEVLRAVGDAGYTTPTPIQEAAIPVVLQGRDLLGCAQTGTGKTASFTLPMIDILAAGRARARMPRSLILEPTRELAAQVAENFEVYGKYNKLTMALLIGGSSMADQIKVLDRGVDVLIATPGRLLDMFERGRLLMSDVKTLVIDEADRMLDMGFIPDVEKIVSLLSPMRQTLFFSATMPPEIRKLADKFLSNPREVSVAPPSTPAKTVTQGLVTVKVQKERGRPTTGHKEKRAALRALIAQEEVRNALVFCNRKRDVGVAYRSMVRHGYSAGQLHGDMSQPARTETLDKFKKGEMTFLVCSDVAARGLDIQDLSHVFNLDIPTHAEDYVHRIGRTGRAGREGRAFTIVTPDEGKYVSAIERLIGLAIPRVEVVGGESVELEPSDERRGRRRGRGRRSDEWERRDRAPAGAVAEAPDEARHEAAPEAPYGAPYEAPHEAPHEAPGERPAAGSDDEGRAPRERRGRDRGRDRDRDRGRDRNRDRDRDADRDEAPVVGMGDHVPAFLLRSALPKDREDA